MQDIETADEGGAVAASNYPTDVGRLAAELGDFIEWRGHARVPEMYCTEQGYPLGAEIADARYRRNRGKLPEQVERELAEAGMCWSPSPQQRWDDGLTALTEYRRAHGHEDPPTHHIADDGFRVGGWVAWTRRCWRGGRLSRQQIASLKRLGVKPALQVDREQLWSSHFAALEKFVAQHGSTVVPSNYVTDDGLNLGEWVQRRRKEYSQGQLRQDKVEHLDRLKFVWKVTLHDQHWQQRYQTLCDWGREHGDVNVASTVVTADGVPLGRWLANQRLQHRRGDMPRERKALLTALGVQWNHRATFDARWEAAVVELQRFISAHGHADVPLRYTAENGFLVGRWLQKQHHRWREGALPIERIEQLKDVGVVARTRRRPPPRKAAGAHRRMAA